MEREIPTNTTNKRTRAPKEFKLVAGQMPVVSGKVKPSSEKGEIIFYFQDEMLKFEWRNTETNIFTEPLVIFEDEWEWTKVPTQKGRVYKLQSKNFPEDKYFFWMQYPNKADDDLNEIIINKILCTGKLEIKEGGFKENGNDMDVDMEDSGVESVIKKEEARETREANINANIANPKLPNTNIANNVDSRNAEFIKNFTNSLAAVTKGGKATKSAKKKYPSLGKILTKTNIIKILDDNSVQELIKLLPENQQNKQQLIENISSPQFQQALESLSHALNSENLPFILSSFGLNTQTGLSSFNGVEAFIRCIIEKFKNNK